MVEPWLYVLISVRSLGCLPYQPFEAFMQSKAETRRCWGLPQTMEGNPDGCWWPDDTTTRKVKHHNSLGGREDLLEADNCIYAV